jgi:hypothetical protein
MPEKIASDALPKDDHGHVYGSDVERAEHGYAPILDPATMASREEREAAAREELGDDANASPLEKGRIETDAEAAARVNQTRTARPPAATGEARSVIVNGVAMLVPAGPDAQATGLPAEAQAVLDDAARPMRTGQMKGLGNGLRTYDLTRKDAANPSGSPSEVIKATSEATAAQAEASETAARATTPDARASRKA